MLEEQAKKKDGEIQKQSDEIQKLKNAKNKLTKELNELQKKGTETDRLKLEDLIPTKENESVDPFGDDQ